MDKSLFINMSGAQNSMRQLEIITNNLANINTTGFKADNAFVEQYKLNASQNESRVFSRVNKTFTDFKQGSVYTTDRDLDVAIRGNGFIAVQSKNGVEGYTRDGSLQIRDGVLVSKGGDIVLGNSGPINIPQAERISINEDGSVAAKYAGNDEMVPIDKIKLVNPDVTQLSKGKDTLFYLNGNGTAPIDTNVTLMPGALEGSNVSAIETMTQLIDLTRSYQVHTNFMRTISEDTAKLNQLLDVTR